MPNKRAKAKFRVGQVLCIRHGWMNAGLYGLVWQIHKGKDFPEYSFRDGRVVSEIALRPLTERERGEVRHGE